MACIAEHIHLLRARQLDTLILCAVYAGSRTVNRQPTFVHDILPAYNACYWIMGSTEACAGAIRQPFCSLICVFYRAKKKAMT